MTVSPPQLVAAADLPCQLGRYRLLSVLGEGGMARVFRAELMGPAGFRKPVALKMLKKGLLKYPNLVHEARLGGLLKHPNIVDIYELNEHDGCGFISMELVSGLSLRVISKDRTDLPPSVFLDLVMGATAGLAQAHAVQIGGRPAGLVHRDLKPSNILVSWNGEVKIADFGIAETRSNTWADDSDEQRPVVGTPQYMSPEQVQGRELDGRSDLFSLGLVFFEIATGRRLLRSGDLLQKLPSAVREERSLLTKVGRRELDGYIDGLGNLVERCLQPLPALRYSSARELGVALQGLRDRVGHRPGLQTWLRGVYPDLSAELNRVIATPSPTRLDVDIPTSATSLEPLQPLSNLGPDLDAFIGRQEELEELDRWTEQGARLITIKGPGGAGKTRLARRFACRCLHTRSGGAWFIDLTESRAAMAIVYAMSLALDIPLSSDWELEGLVRRVGHALKGRGPLLIVLDNFEQILDHASDTLGCWLKMAPDCLFVVTTRERLRMGGEQVLELASMPEADGIKLFDLRASAVGARWEDTPEHRQAIAEIVQELDGIPLAIELAASRAVHLPPISLRERLKARFALLGGARRDHDARQATLWNLIDWSWSLLADWEQSALAQLSVFRDGFFLESAEAVLDLSDYPDAPWVLDVVSALLDKSLLHSREVLGQPRFRMYLSVREFAEQQLADRDLSGETRQRHAAHFSVLGSEEAIRSLSCHAGLQRRRQLEVELDNCRVAAEHAVHLPDPAVAVGCTMAVAVFLVYSGPFAVGVQLVDPVLDHPGIGERGRLRLFQVRGDLQFYAGQLSSAEQDYRQAIARGRSLEVPRHLVRAMNGLGSLLLQQGRLEESREIIEQAIQVGVNAKAPGLEIHSRRNLAILHRESDGELDYRSVLFESLRYDREQGNRSAEAMDLANIAISEMETGEADRAEEHYRASLAIHGELGNRRLQSITRGNLANLVKKQGRSEEALELYRQALQGLREAGDRRASGHVLSNFGNLYRQQGQLDDAERCLVEAMSIARELENPRGLAVGLGNLGDVLLDQGRLDEAREYLVEAIEQCEVSYALPGGAFKASLALIEAHAGKYTEAKALLDAGEQILRGAHTEELAKLLCKRGMVALMAGDRVQAVDALEEARAIRLEIGAGMDSELGSLLLQFEQGLTESD